MPHTLNGLRVVSFESRRAAEMAELIRNYGGEARSIGARASASRRKSTSRTLLPLYREMDMTYWLEKAEAELK